MGKKKTPKKKTNVTFSIYALALFPTVHLIYLFKLVICIFLEGGHLSTCLENITPEMELQTRNRKWLKRLAYSTSS